MKIEFEATFLNQDKNVVRNKLKKVKARLLKKEILMKRRVFDLPKGNNIKGGWLRVRDEGDKITMSLKVVDGNKIHNQKEACLTVNNFDEACAFLKLIGCREKSFQKTKRESWVLNDCEITIDEWPFLESFVEIEGKNEKEVKRVAKKLGYDYKDAYFCAVDTIYQKKYGVNFNFVNGLPKIVFNMKNPFIVSKK